MVESRKNKLNDDYGIYYNLHSREISESSDDETMVMSRVDWVVALRDIFKSM
jgi:hypothetical protein